MKGLLLSFNAGLLRQQSAAPLVGVKRGFLSALQAALRAHKSVARLIGQRATRRATTTPLAFGQQERRACARIALES